MPTNTRSSSTRTLPGDASKPPRPALLSRRKLCESRRGPRRAAAPPRLPSTAGAADSRPSSPPPDESTVRRPDARGSPRSRCPRSASRRAETGAASTGPRSNRHLISPVSAVERPDFVALSSQTTCPSPTTGARVDSSSTDQRSRPEGTASADSRSGRRAMKTCAAVSGRRSRTDPRASGVRHLCAHRLRLRLRLRLATRARDRGGTVHRRTRQRARICEKGS